MLKHLMFIVLFTLPVINSQAQQTEQGAKHGLIILMDESYSMKHRVSDITRALQLTNQFLPIDLLNESVAYIGFTMEVTSEFSGTLDDVIDVMQNIEFIESHESVFVALKAVAKNKDFTNATVLMFSDGKRQEMSTEDAEEIAAKFNKRNLTLHAFQHVNASCNNHRALAFNKINQIYTATNTLAQCENQAPLFSSDFEPLGMTKKPGAVAINTGGLFWSISHVEGPVQPMNEKTFDSEAVAALLSQQIQANLQQDLFSYISYEPIQQIADSAYFQVINDLPAKYRQTPDSWEWDFNDDGVVDDYGQNVSYLFPTSGTKNIKVTFKDYDETKSVTQQLLLTVQQ